MGIVVEITYRFKNIIHRKRYLRLLTGLLLAMSVACSNDDYRFQTFEPSNKVKLTELLDETPALHSVFAGMDASVFNQKLDALIRTDPVTGIKFMDSLSRLSREEPMLPRLLGESGGALDQFVEYYTSTPERRAEYAAGLEVGGRLLDTEPAAIRDGTDVLARIIRYSGDHDQLFASASSEQFPSRTLWQTCDDPNDNFLSARPAYDPDEEGRQALFSMYDILRLAYCLYEDETVVSGDVPGEFMKNTLQTLKDSGDIELRVRNLARTLDEDRAEIREMEVALGDWLARDPDKVAITDYLTDDLYGLLEKDEVFTKAHPLLDVEAAHLSQRDPDDQDRGLLEWLMQAVYTDAPKLDQLENYTDLDTTSPLYTFGQGLIEDNTYGLRRIFNPDGSVYPQNTLKEMLWSGRIYTSSVGTPFAVKGLLYNDATVNVSNDGPVAQMAQLSSSQLNANNYRNKMKSALSGIVDVPETNNGEAMLESILNNVYFYLMSQFYDTGQREWALTSEDGHDKFSDPSRAVLPYIGRMQYALRNMVVANPFGEPAGSAAPSWAWGDAASDTDYRNMPYLSALLYTMAVANGYVDDTNAPAELTLQKSLESMGATIDSNGQRVVTIELFLGISMDLTVTVACSTTTCETGTIFRNGEPYTTALGMFDFELLSPGRFISRDGSTNRGWKGQFSAHQGDVETTKQKTANWVMSEIAINTWEGYGPYTVKGSAPDGSRLKYENDFYTDLYKTKLCTDAEGNVAGDQCVSSTYNAMGANGNNTNGNGNYHLFERIYRPLKQGQPCWSDATVNGKYDYARYGYIRPSTDTTYHDNSNCSSWAKIQVDFDSPEEAVRANLDWLLNYKKYIFVIPMYGVTNKEILGVDNGASFSVFATINANGIAGVTTAKRAGGTMTDNARWNNSPTVNMMGVNGDGVVGASNSSHGFITETPTPGASITVRYGRTSFEARDSAVILDMTTADWGGTALLVNMYEKIWETLGNGPVTPQIIGDNFGPILAMSEAVYTQSELMADTSQAATPDISKFQKFYDTYFTTDETSCSGSTKSTGSNGAPDLFENYENGCITASELPPLPQVNGVSYPESYDSAGNVAIWYTYNGPSEGRFSSVLYLVSMIVGTIHEDGTMYKSGMQPLNAGENRDDVNFISYAKDLNGNNLIEDNDLDGYRKHLDTLIDVFITLNESEKKAGSNMPAYNSKALTNLLVETSAGSRDGFLPYLVSNKYANPADIGPLVDDLEQLIRDNAVKILDQFETTTGIIKSGETIANKDRLRYFATGEVIDEAVFSSNRLKKADYSSQPADVQTRLDATLDQTDGEPVNMLKAFLGYLRDITADDEVVTTIKNGIDTLNLYFKVKVIDVNLSVTDEDIDRVVAFLNAKNDKDEYAVDTFLDLLIETKMNDIDTLRKFTFDQFKDLDSDSFSTKLDSINKAIDSHFEVNYKKNLLYSSFMLGEPTCPGGAAAGYYDHNGDGNYQRGIFTFVTGSFSGDIYVDQANINGSCEISTLVPDIYNPHSYILRMDSVVSHLNEGLLNLNETKIDDSLDRVYDDTTGPGDDHRFDFDVIVTNIKNDIIGSIYDIQIEEPSFDADGDGSIESGEFTDLSKDTVFNKSDLRSFVSYYVSDTTAEDSRKSVLRDLYETMNTDGYLALMNDALGELFSPLPCSTDTCRPGNTHDYVTGDLMTARKQLSDSLDITPAEFKSLKNVAGHLLYDTENGQYTYVVTRTSPYLAGLLREFEGDYDRLLDLGIAGFQPDGFLTYMSSDLSPSESYDSLDILGDLGTLVNSPAMHYEDFPGFKGSNDPVWYLNPHDGKWYYNNTGSGFAFDSNQQNPWCTAWHNEKFWCQFGDLLEDFSQVSARKFITEWQNNDVPVHYYEDLAGIFQ